MASVLVVDDSRFTRTRLTETIHREGHHVLEASDGLEALELFEAAHPDLVVSDLLMPRMDGFQLLEELQRRASDVPVIILSADIQTTSRTRCHELGATEFLNKPVNLDELRRAVASALEALVVAEGGVSA